VTNCLYTYVIVLRTIHISGALKTMNKK